MTSLLAIIRRELAGFFHSAVAPVVLTGFLVSVGLFFTNFVFGYSEMSLTALQTPATGSYLNLAEGLFRPLVSNVVFFLLFLLPALSMRLMAPDLRPGRRELVASWPVSDGTWILGKWLGGSLAAIAMIGAGAAYMLAVWTFGRPEAGPAVTAFLGQVLLASCLVAWGLLASCLVSHQVVAYFLAFMTSLLLFIIGVFERFVPGPAGTLARELSILTHFERFSRGVIDTLDLVYFAGMTAIALAFAWAVHAGRRLPPGRRLGPWVPTLLTLVVAVLLYLVAGQFRQSWDLTGNQRYSLAPQSVQLLERLGDLLDGKDPDAAGGDGALSEGAAKAEFVQVYAFYQKLDPAREVTEALLSSCSQRTRRFRYSIVDPEVDLDLFRKFELGSSRSVVITVGDRHTTLMQPEESALLSAVYRLASGRLSRVMFLTGHGEHMLDSSERPGYLSTSVALSDQGYDVRPLTLSGGARVPESCDVLVIAGPRLDPEPSEVAAIDAFLARGGAVLALTDPPTPAGWSAWLRGWRLVPTGEVLIDAERLSVAQGLGPRTVAIIDTYSHHEIVHSLHGLVTTFPLSQPVMRTEGTDSTLFGGPLLSTGERTWGETDPGTMFTGRPEFDPATDTRGPLPFGWVLEARRGQERPGRLVVIGNSEFLNNATVNQGANRDLLLNIMGWLAREQALIQVRGRDPLSQPVVLSASQKEVYGWGAILGWPLLVGSLALGIMLRSRREPRKRP
ncbi:MAG: Gldg family protein [bacterium]|nr:Gldg family protein [bacterium]